MEFFIERDGREQGPFNLDAPELDGLDPQTRVWRVGMLEWTPAAKVPKLAGRLAHHSGPEPLKRDLLAIVSVLLAVVVIGIEVRFFRGVLRLSQFDGGFAFDLLIFGICALFLSFIGMMVGFVAVCRSYPQIGLAFVGFFLNVALLLAPIAWKIFDRSDASDGF